MTLISVIDQAGQCARQRVDIDFVVQHHHRIPLKFCHGTMRIDDQRQAIVQCIKRRGRGFAARACAQLNRDVGRGEISLVGLLIHIASDLYL